MDWSNRKDILVFLEQKEGQPIRSGLESLTAAKMLAGKTGGKVIGLLIGQDNGQAAAVSAPFAAQVLSAQGAAFSSGANDAFVLALEQAVQQTNPAAVLAGNTPLGREVTARLCARLETAGIQDAIALSLEGDMPRWTVPLYGGTILQEVESERLPLVATLRSGCFVKPLAGSPGEITAFPVEVSAGDFSVKVRETVREIAQQVDLESAQVIVAGGRGMGSAENFALVEQLAQVLGGVVGATRPAIEAGWVSRDHQVGQSGKIVAPALYIACGVSGAAQHLSGMAGSGYVVAINQDEEAPIFDVADVGIVGDAVQVIPAMIAEIQARREG